MICHSCGGQLKVLGALGSNVWGRCEDCGTDSTLPAEALEESEETDG